MPLSSKISVSFSGQHTTALDLGTTTLPFSAALALTLATGTGANQADRVFTDERTLIASATEDLDLAAVLLDAFGQAITFAKLKGILVVAAAGNTNDVLVSRPAANGVPLFAAAADAIPVKPGGFFAWALPGTGITVTAGTADLLTFTNSAGGTPVTYEVILIGTSA
jgi:hypothetical protein